MPQACPGELPVSNYTLLHQSAAVPTPSPAAFGGRRGSWDNKGVGRRASCSKKAEQSTGQARGILGQNSGQVLTFNLL